MDIKLRVLKAKIRGLEIEGKSIRARINCSSGSQKDQLWKLKRELGDYTRAHLIAYGLLRGVPYNKIESNCRVMIDLRNICDVIAEHVSHHQRRFWTVERISNLIWKTDPVTPTETIPLQAAPENLSAPKVSTPLRRAWRLLTGAP